MKTVDQSAQHEDWVKKSRFIGLIMPCRSVPQVNCLLHDLQQQHSGATHIAFAYRIITDTGLAYRFHDAGEPSGTAGKPIFQHLEGKQLVNVLLAVIRYFGGIKLGTGGLTRAYGNTANKAIEAAHVREYVVMTEIPMTLEYPKMPVLSYQLKKIGGEIITQEFTDKVHVTVRIPEAKVKDLESALR